MEQPAEIPQSLVPKPPKRKKTIFDDDYDPEDNSEEDNDSEDAGAAADRDAERIWKFYEYLGPMEKAPSGQRVYDSVYTESNELDSMRVERYFPWYKKGRVDR